MGNPSILVYKNLQSQRNLDTNTDARAAQTAMKCSIPFLLLSDFLPSDLFLAAAGELPRADGCGARAARLPGPARPRARGCRSSTAACEQLPAPSPGSRCPVGRDGSLECPGQGCSRPTGSACMPRGVRTGAMAQKPGVPDRKAFPFPSGVRAKQEQNMSSPKLRQAPLMCNCPC